MKTKTQISLLVYLLKNIHCFSVIPNYLHGFKLFIYRLSKSVDQFTLTLTTFFYSTSSTFARKRKRISLRTSLNNLKSTYIKSVFFFVKWQTTFREGSTYHYQNWVNKTYTMIWIIEIDYQRNLSQFHLFIFFRSLWNILICRERAVIW